MSIELKASSKLPTRFGNFTVSVFVDGHGTEHLTMAAGTPADGCLVRLHSECATGDIMGSLRCDCGNQLELALRKIDEAGNGLLIYIGDHEGRGIGLANKIKAYALQDQGLDTVDANVQLGFAPDQRTYEAAFGILKHFGLQNIRLMSNNRKKIDALTKAGFTITEQVPMWVASNPHNERYLATKRERMGHIGN